MAVSAEPGNTEDTKEKLKAKLRSADLGGGSDVERGKQMLNPFQAVC